ncbi:MAG: hypothetical protein ABI592_06975 [Acidobacteriota bacterium]
MGLILASASRRPANRHPLGDDLPPFDRATGHLHAIGDTPKGSRDKFKLDEDLGLYKLSPSPRRRGPRRTSGR